MASIHQIRGSLLEEVVLLLLTRSGYRRVVAGEEGTHDGKSGLEVEGRGTLHQIDALVTPLHSHAFVYPIRLLVEAKCLAMPVGLATVRSLVGTVFDIDQNYFAGLLPDGRELRMQRFNYHAAVFASNGYSEDAERYALAHQVFLIDYSHVAAMRPIVDALLTLDIEDFGELAQRQGKRNLMRIREGFRTVLENEQPAGVVGVFSVSGIAKINELLLPAIRALHTSCYGMIEGIYPVHLISQRELPVRFIREHPVIPCEIRVDDDEQLWAFEPSNVPQNSPDFFHLEFTLPEAIAEMLNARTTMQPEQEPRWRQIANIKRERVRFVDVTTVTNGQVLGFRLTLDTDWLNRYIRGREPREDRL